MPELIALPPKHSRSELRSQRRRELREKYPTALRMFRKFMKGIRAALGVITIILFATLQNGCVAFWHLLLHIWLGRVEKSYLREDMNDNSYKTLQWFLVFTCAALLSAWLAQMSAFAQGQRDTTYGGAIWIVITFVLIAALINLRDVYKSRMYWFLRKSGRSSRKNNNIHSPMVPAEEKDEENQNQNQNQQGSQNLGLDRQLSVSSDITMDEALQDDLDLDQDLDLDEENKEEDRNQNYCASPSQFTADSPPPPPPETMRPSYMPEPSSNNNVKFSENPPKVRMTIAEAAAREMMGNSTATSLCSKCKASCTILTTVLACIATMTQVANSSRYPPMGKLFDIGDPEYIYPTQNMYRERMMHIWCAGERTHPEQPVVLFEHGWMGSSLDWSMVRRYTKDYTRVCSYDRAGYGWSDRGPNPRTSFQIAAETELMLDKAEEYIWGSKRTPGKDKFVLCGHSMAGFQMRIFTDRNPDMVAGILFADAVNPDYVKGAGYGNRFPANPANYIGSWFLAPTVMPMVTSGIPAIMGVADDAENSDVKTEVDWFAYRYAFILSRSRWFEVANDEWVCWPEHAARTSDSKVLGANATLGDLPITVFVAMESAAFDSYHEGEALQDLSTDSRLHLLPNAEHGFIFNKEYSQELNSAIIELIERTNKTDTDN
ncbi:hypothetical protein TL16_g06935 [Triparma laevis f. inornata]|uniref:AB hydrolase-1 domain-containing protein n=1 Tax=Triparma laevis f. inornata TaxID=1714386 RepID=A0A9W7EEN0_9STRA|nr:hypothetical protein TL16_g06935 [Triparma laevis f. inornata]